MGTKARLQDSSPRAKTGSRKRLYLTKLSVQCLYSKNIYLQSNFNFE